ncbi:15614_t:CDS:1 [Cetraspora pellucida]|uniref:15614_t:CDS:1 n=1 Tax=Cetraspora pellucida TaxID=1433469 RepID=A0ACA9K6W3_9GLOM|nr:15614_t:CDS:1 [Cetraspora pellucida]
MFLLVFGLIDGMLLSATAGKVRDGAWFPLLMATILFVIMGLWRWGTSRKVEYESLQSTNLDEIFEVIHHTPPLSMVAEKSEVSENDETKESSKNPSRNSFSNFSIRSIETILQRNIIRQFGKTTRIRMLDTGFLITRLPGIVLFYSDVGSCIPLSFTHFINHFPALPQIIIFMTIHHVAIPHVIEDDRLIVSKIGDYDGCYQVVSRYGYMDDVIHGEEFISKLVASIQLADKHLSDKIVLKELPVTYVFGHQIFSPKPNSSWWRRRFVNCYKFLVNNSREIYSSWYIPSENFIGVGMKTEI